MHACSHTGQAARMLCREKAVAANSYCATQSTPTGQAEKLTWPRWESNPRHLVGSKSIGLLSKSDSAAMFIIDSI